METIYPASRLMNFQGRIGWLTGYNPTREQWDLRTAFEIRILSWLEVMHLCSSATDQEVRDFYAEQESTRKELCAYYDRMDRAGRYTGD